MATWRNRFSDEEADQISESSGSESEAETDSTYCSSDTDRDFDETSSQSTSRSTHDEPWRIGNFRPNKLTFMSTNSGWTSIIIQKLKGDTPMDFFNLFFDENLMGTIVDQTNLYYYQAGKASSKAAKTPSWSDTTIDEMYVFLATTMLMSFTKKNKLLSYWSTDRLIMTPIFNQLFPRHRYFAILQYLHFNNNTEQPDDDRLYKVNPVLHQLKEKFSNSFYPYQNICIDEGMIAFKGRLKFKQYIPSKRKRFGIKLFLICDCSTGFILNFIVYTGSTTERVRTSEFDIPGSIVMLLLEKYLDKGHIIYVDNWYSSPKLFRVLYERSTGACGTIRKNRSGFPVFQEKLQQGEQSVLHTANMLALKWHDKRDVYMLSTVHDSSMVSIGKKNSFTGEEILKPLCVKEYNQNKGAVDKSCMQMTFSESLRKSVKWYKKLFFHMMDVSVLNAYILFKNIRQQHLQLFKFKLEVIRGLVAKYGSNKPHVGRALTAHPLRLTARHFPSLIPPNESSEAPRRRCYVCGNTERRAKQRSDTRYQCLECDVGLCITDCFKDFHTLQKI